MPVPMQSMCGKSGQCRVDKRKPTFSNIFILPEPRHRAIEAPSRRHRGAIEAPSRRHRAIEPSSHRGLMPTEDGHTDFGHRAIEAPSRRHRAWHRASIEPASSFCHRAIEARAQSDRERAARRTEETDTNGGTRSTSDRTTGTAGRNRKHGQRKEGQHTPGASTA